MTSQSWSQLDLRHLLALQAVAREGSFAEGAAALGYTQSAISQQIGALERTVGHRLIERPGGRRPIWLTEAGELLLRHAEGAFAELQAATEDLAALSAGRLGRLRVGAYQSVGTRLLPAIVSRFNRIYPNVALELFEANDDDELFGMLGRGELDLSFALLPPPEGAFDGIELLRDPYVLVVAAGSPLAEPAETPTLQAIARLPLIGFKACRQERWLESHIQAHAARPQWVFRSDDNTTIQAMAAAEVGVALVPRLTIDPTDPATAVIELGELIPPRRLGLVWHADRSRSEAAETFIALAREGTDAPRSVSDTARPLRDNSD
jgi:DNA-binding transcriptional LysR family regulator